MGKRRLDILIVQYTNPDHYPPTINAIWVMAQAGLRVGVICRRDWPETGVCYPDHVWLRRVGGKPKGGARAPLSFITFLAWVFFSAIYEHPRLIYCYDLHGIVAGGLVGELLQIPYIYHVHDIFLPEEGMGAFDRRLKPIEKRLANRSIHLVFPSASKAQFFLKVSGISRPYSVVANAPRKDIEARNDSSESPIRDLASSSRHIVLYQGSIGPGKGLDELIISMSAWPKECVLVLMGIVRPPSYIETLKTLARTNSVEERLFYLGLINYNDLFNVTRMAHLGVYLPTSASVMHMTSGTAINKVLEYMACGVPVLVSAFPALNELIEEIGAGMAIEVSDPANIARAVRIMLESEERWRSWSENGRKAFLEKYNYETQFKPVMEVITRLLPVAERSG